MIENGKLIPSDDRSFESEDGDVLPLAEPFAPEPFDYDSIEVPGPDVEIEPGKPSETTERLGAVASAETKPVVPKSLRRPQYRDWASAAANDPIEDDDDE